MCSDWHYIWYCNINIIKLKPIPDLHGHGQSHINRRTQAGYFRLVHPDWEGQKTNKPNMVVTFKQASVSLHSKQVYLYFFVLKMYWMACYESESTTCDFPGSHRKCEKPKMEIAQTFLSYKQRKIRNFSSVLVSCSYRSFQNGSIFREKLKIFRTTMDATRFGFWEAWRTGVVSLSLSNCLTHEQNFHALIRITSSIRLSITDGKTPRKCEP